MAKLDYPVVAETGMRRNDIMNEVNQLILYVSRTIPFRSDLDRHLIRAAMVFTFFAFSPGVMYTQVNNGLANGDGDPVPA